MPDRRERGHGAPDLMTLLVVFAPLVLIPAGVLALVAGLVTIAVVRWRSSSKPNDQNKGDTHE